MPTPKRIVGVPPARIWAAAFAAIAAAAAAFACDTPVYRYAMYRWQPAPYEIYYFYRSEQAADFAALQERIGELAARPLAPPNVQVFTVDLEQDPELKSVPRDVRALWQARPTQDVPAQLIVNPMGHQV
ncbi:MAG: hypothetical protein KDJ41_14625, partial [Hyphomicrobiaceae bacterium]|nr:hypothetical protein [Hyphomicrobiaceae bacterium]